MEDDILVYDFACFTKFKYSIGKSEMGVKGGLKRWLETEYSESFKLIIVIFNLVYVCKRWFMF